MIKLQVDTNRLQMILNDYELRIAELEKLVKHPPLHIDENGNLHKGYRTENAELMRVINLAEDALKAGGTFGGQADAEYKRALAMHEIIKLKEKNNGQR